MFLSLLGALTATSVVAAAFGIPSGAALVYADVAAAGALGGALLAVGVARVRRRPAPLRTLGFSALAAILGAAHLALAPAGPAVIVVVVDCLRADRLNADTMPRMTAWTADTVRFQAARSQSSWTRSSMPSLLSGRYPAEHGLYRTRPPDRIRADVPMLAEVFRAAGWVTAAFVEQAQLDATFGYARGFGRYGFHDGRARRINQRFTWWNRLFRTTPRFVFLHYLDIHGPYTPPKRFVAADNPKSRIASRPSHKWRTTIRRSRKGELLLSANDYAHLAGLYDGTIRELDQRLGALVDGLDADGTLDNAWVVFTADHGERFGEHGDLEHMGAPQEVVLSVPLVIRPPGGTAYRTPDDVVQLVDVAPTLLHAVGIDPPPDLPGRDLAPALRGEPLPAAASFAEEWSTGVHRASVRFGDWKLLHDGAAALYDLAADPGETDDVAADHPEVVAELQGMLAAYFAAADADQPIAGVDWGAARTSGATWTPRPFQAGDDVEVSDGTMEALEALGYLEDE